jgi:hypothetical protein
LHTRPGGGSVLTPVQFNPPGERTNDDEDIAVIREGTDVVDIRSPSSGDHKLRSLGASYHHNLLISVGT